jgi:hypothetical protein
VLARDAACLEAHVALGRLLVSAGREAEALKSYTELLGVLERRDETPEPGGGLE